MHHEHQHNTCGNEILAKNQNHTDHNNDHQDTCPPFCVCSCCGSNVIIPSQIFYKEISEKIFLHSLDGYVSNYSFQFNTSVWHPPTLS